MLRILGRLSSINVRKVVWACGELGVAFDREDWGAGFRSPYEDDFLALNPNAQVPVIDDGGFVLWESNAVVRYLAGKYGGEALLGDSSEQRARVDQWFTWQATDLTNAAGYATRALIRKLPDADNPALLAQSLSSWTDKIAILDGQLGRSGGFAAGPVLSVADIGLGLAVHRWLSLEADVPEFGNVRAYHDRVKAETGILRSGALDYP